jgi:hypothetical protein
MPVLNVLIDEDGHVAGTSQGDNRGYESDGPTQVTMVARPGQEVVEVTIDDDIGSLDPDALHATIEKVHLKRRNSKKAK